MKIEMQDLPKVWAALDKLLRDQHNLATVSDHPSDYAVNEPSYRVIGMDGVHAGEISNEELVGVLQARVDETLKHLRQRYQIDFAPAPTLSIAPSGHAASPPARNPGPADVMNPNPADDLGARTE